MKILSAESIAAIIDPMAALNSWARLPLQEQIGMERAVSSIYRYKRAVIASAIRAGIAKLRLSSIERPCKTCKGTGQYEWVNWHDEDDVRYEDCRRCGATGQVTLRFVVSEIVGQQWNTPRPKWDLGVFTEDDWSKHCEPETEWEPERPGKPLSFLPLVAALNAVESALLPPLVPYESWPAPGSLLPDYRLYLGDYPGCPFCGAEQARGRSGPKPIWDVHRPCLSWGQDYCWGDGRDCVWAALNAPLQWPHDVNPPRFDRNRPDDWTYHVPLPEVAHHPVVTEWLARRGVVIGSWPPDELAWHQSGILVRVKAALPSGKLLLALFDSQDWLGGRGYGDDPTPTFEAPPSSIRARQRGGPWTEVPPVEYSAEWVVR